MTERKYSERLGVLSDAQLQAALDRFDLGDLLAAEPAPMGLFGQNVFLTTAKGEYVLRGAPYPSWRFEKEQFLTRLLHEQTDVPVPWPFDIDPRDDIFGWSYAVMPKMPGVQVGDPAVRTSLTAKEKQALARAMGENLARMHSLTWPRCGEYDPDAVSIKPIDTTFAEWAVVRIRRWLDLCLAASDVTTSEDVAWVESIIASGRGALDVPFEPTFVHHDYKENNAVAERTGAGWRITGVFDVGGGYFGDPEEDLARSVATYAMEDVALARAFLAGYQAQRSFRSGFTERFPMYMLADRLVIWEYGQRNKVWFDESAVLREWAGWYTALNLA
ncbi:MAG: aminoglycoside phosphotransferase family protein [Dehalococcoidia bacterium]